MKVTSQEYQRMNKKASPKSPVLKNCLWAFFVGGFICTLGQVVADLCQNAGLEQTDARMVASISLIFISMVLTGFQVYDNIAKHAGAGTLVPITGFANSIVSPAIEFKSEGYVTGLGAKMFTIAGPVLVYGIVTSIVYGLIYYVVSLM